MLATTYKIVDGAYIPSNSYIKNIPFEISFSDIEDLLRDTNRLKEDEYLLIRLTLRSFPPIFQELSERGVKEMRDWEDLLKEIESEL